MSIAKEINRRKAKERRDTEYRAQLCWMCRKAVATSECHCSWSKDLEPVSGWDAKKQATHGKPKYYITKCPEFVPDQTTWAVAVESARICDNKRRVIPMFVARMKSI